MTQKTRSFIFCTIAGSLLIGSYVWYQSTQTVTLKSPLLISLPNRQTGKYKEQAIEKYVREHGKKLAQAQKYKPKIAIYERMLAKDPSNLAIKKQLSLFYFYARDVNKARPLLIELEQTPLADATLYYALAQISWIDKNVEQSKGYVDLALKLDANHFLSNELLKKIGENPTPPK